MLKEMKYKIELLTNEPLRIGGKGDPRSGIDNPVAIVGNKAVVPGSTLKGALRFEIERFLIERYYDKQNKKWPDDKIALQPCIPATKLSKDEEFLLNNRYYKLYNQYKDGQGFIEGRGCHYECAPNKCHNETHNICPACYLLGAMGLNGFVRVPFLFAEISPKELYSTRLDRAKGTVVQGTNRPVQLVPQNVTFTGILTVITKDDILDWELGKPRPLKEINRGDAWLPNNEWTQGNIIKDLIAERLKGINLIGGYRSKGFGNVKIDVTEQG